MIKLIKELEDESSESIIDVSPEELIRMFNDLPDTTRSANEFENISIVGNAFTINNVFYEVLSCSKKVETGSPITFYPEKIFFGIKND